MLSILNNRKNGDLSSPEVRKADMSTKVKRSDILFRSMEADMFVKVKRSDILSISMEANMFAKVKGSNICPEV